MTTYTVTKRTLAARLGTAINSSKNIYVLRCRRYGNTMMNTNNDLKLSSLELCKNSKEEVGQDRSVSSNKFSSVTLNKLAMNR